MVDVAGQAPTLAELDEDGRNAVFDRLQARMPRRVDSRCGATTRASRWSSCRR